MKQVKDFVMDNAAVIVRRILSRFALSKIIGIQPVTDKKNPTVVSGGLTYDIDVVTRPLQCGYPDMPKADIKIHNGIDFECEINQERQIINP